MRKPFSIQPEGRRLIVFDKEELTAREILEQTLTLLSASYTWNGYKVSGWLSGGWYRPAAPGLGNRACSVGAMLLSLNLQGLQNLPFGSWDALCDGDPEFKKALGIVYWQIMDLYPGHICERAHVMTQVAELGVGAWMVDTIVSWNDATERTYTKVLDLFERAVKQAVKEEECS